MTPTIQTLSPTVTVQLPQPTGSVTILSPTETGLPTEPPEPTGQLSQIALAGIIIGAIVAAISLLVIVIISIRLFAGGGESTLFRQLYNQMSMVHMSQILAGFTLVNLLETLIKKIFQVHISQWRKGQEYI